MSKFIDFGLKFVIFDVGLDKKDKIVSEKLGLCVWDNKDSNLIAGSFG